MQKLQSSYFIFIFVFQKSETQIENKMRSLVVIAVSILLIVCNYVIAVPIPDHCNGNYPGHHMFCH